MFMFPEYAKIFIRSNAKVAEKERQRKSESVFECFFGRVLISEFSNYLHLRMYECDVVRLFARARAPLIIIANHCY